MSDEQSDDRNDEFDASKVIEHDDRTEATSEVSRMVATMTPDSLLITILDGRDKFLATGRLLAGEI